MITKGEDQRKAFQFKASLETFQKALEIEPQNAEILWRIARTNIDLSKKTTNKKLAIPFYEKAEITARKGVSADPKNSRCHTYVAVAIGKVALTKGSREKVKLSREIKSEALKAIELDPKNDTAYHVLARWHVGVANLGKIAKAFAKIFYGGLPGASNEEAINYFKKAIELKPDHINHRLELAKTYEIMKKWKLADEALKPIADMPNIDYDDKAHKRTAADLLKKIRKKLK